jgi:hypothetical protein
MRNYFFACVFALYVLLTFSVARAETPATTGFIPGQIWYSKEVLTEGDTVKIYTAVWNGDSNPLSIHVEFYDKNILLGARDIVVAPVQIEDVSVSWKVTSGDHSISAKITSSSLTVSGKKQQIVLDRATTTEDHTFVPLTVKTSDGTPVLGSTAIKTQVDKIALSIENAIPKSIGTPISNTLNSFDAFRDTTYTQIVTSKNETKKRLDALESSPTDAKESTIEEGTSSKSADATQKPIAYIKMFFLSVAAFIFGHKIVFYGIVVFLAFLVLRYLYYKIRRR